MRGTAGRSIVIAVMVILGGSAAFSSTIYNDGGTHTVSGISAEIVVSNGTTLNVASGAAITGISATPAVAVNGNSTVTVAPGSTLTGGPATSAGNGGNAGSGLQATESRVTISGGTFAGGNSASGTGNSAGSGLYFFAALASHPLLVTGGTFLGGSGDAGAGDGASIVLAGLASGTITGGVFVAGTPERISSGKSLYLSESGRGSLTISGGEFTGPATVLLSDNASLTFMGSGLSYFNQTISGILSDGTPINLPLSVPLGARLTGDSTRLMLNASISLGAVPGPPSMVLGTIALALLGGWHGFVSKSQPVS